MLRARVGLAAAAAAIALFTLSGKCEREDVAIPHPPKTGQRSLHDPRMKETVEDLFPGMDGPGIQFTEADLRGRIVWNVWTGDSYRMWDYLAKHGFGTSDLLKTIDSRGRATRFRRTGMINQPGFQRAPKADRYGLFLDVPNDGHPAGQIDRKLDEYTYGRSSGVVGLRIFKNPEFDAAAEAEWKKHIAADGINHDYYENPAYYNQPALKRPYAVGMACAFCHVSHDPVRPAKNFEEPEWANLNDYAGAQYLKVWEVFGNGMGEESFVWQLLHSNPPGTLDTSFIATDFLNNPGTMNALYNLPQRLSRAEPEEISGGALALRNVKPVMSVPRVLKQGEDSVGFEAALSRVYVNIGNAWPEWSQHFRPLIGGRDAKGKQTPVDVATLQRTSAHWNWSEERAPMLAGYLVKVARPLLLKDAPDNERFLPKDAAVLQRGKLVFAENCAGCHSSKQPEGLDPRSPEAKAWFREQVITDPEFFADNFLADERRHPVNVIGTNATRAAATNAKRGHIWDNFSSETYKTLPAVSKFTVDNGPYGKVDIEIPGGGPGYYRPPSLISLWSSAPYLHNNSVGDDFGDPSVAGRMRAFQDGIERMLLIQPRRNVIWRTTKESWITIPQSYVPPILGEMILDPSLKDSHGNFRIGPIPKNTPVNLLANTNLEGDVGALLRLGGALARALIAIDLRDMNEQQATARLREVIPQLIAANKCPDLVEDKGHMFGTKLPLSDKRALIELLKTF